jgi:hypothetical protein
MSVGIETTARTSVLLNHLESNDGASFWFIVVVIKTIDDQSPVKHCEVITSLLAAELKTPQGMRWVISAVWSVRSKLANVQCRHVVNPTKLRLCSRFGDKKVSELHRRRM